MVNLHSIQQQATSLQSVSFWRSRKLVQKGRPPSSFNPVRKHGVVSLLPKDSWKVQRNMNLKSRAQVLPAEADKDRVQQRSVNGAADQAEQWPGLRATVCGAGPSGALMAILLARQGFQVDIYERNAWGTSGWIRKSWGWTVALTSRALRALEEVGLLEEVEARSSKIKYQALLEGQGATATFHYRKLNHQVLSCYLPDLTEVLIKAGMTEYPNRIKYHFGWGLESLNVGSSTATFIGVGGGEGSGTPGAKLVARGDLVVGADGLGSVTRRELQAQVEGFDVTLRCEGTGKAVSVAVPDGMVSASLEIQSPLKGQECQFDPRSFMIWQRPPRQLGIMPSAGNRVGFNFQGVGLRGESAADVAEQIKESFPEVAHLFGHESEACRQLAASRELRHCTVHTSQFHHNSVVLLGDAAHACLNFTGQGINLALEDCLVLDSLIAGHLQEAKLRKPSRDVARAAVACALATFTSVRKGETDAAAEMSEGIPKENLVLATLQFNMMTMLSKLLPGVRPWQDTLAATVVSPREVKAWRLIEIIGFRSFGVFVSVLVVYAMIQAMAEMLGS